MSDKPWDDAETLARLYKTEDMSYSEIAEELGCSSGTVSIRFNEDYYPSLVEEIESYDASDFQGEKHVEELAELEKEEIIEVLNEYLTDRYAEPTSETGDVYVERLYLAIFVAGVEVGEAVEAAYGSGVKNPCVAVSEHHYSDTLQERMDNEAVGLLVVEEDDVRVESECELTRGSGVQSLFHRDYGPGVSYQQAAWLREQVESGKDIREIADDTSLLPRSIESKLDDFGISS